MATTIKELLTYTEALNDQLDYVYTDALAQTTNWVTQFTDMNVPVKGESVRFPFLLDDGDIRQSKEGDPPIYEELQGKSTEISWLQFDKGLRIKISQFSDPYWQNMFMKRVNGLSTRMAYLPLARLCNALNYGDTDAYYTMWDSKQFFATDHSLNGRTYCNLFNAEFSEDNFIAVQAAMEAIPWSQENYTYLPMDGAKWTVILHPSKRFEARKILQNAMYAKENYNTENVLQNEADVITTNRLIDKNDWFLIATLPGINPFIHVENTEEWTRQLIDENDSWKETVKRGWYQWFIRTQEEVFPSNWFMVSKCKYAGGTVS
jgi:hypothetical protein